MTDNSDAQKQTTNQKIDRQTKGINRKRVVTFVVGIALLCLFTFTGIIKSVPYVTENPEFCRNCHTMKPYFYSWQDSGHDKTSCFSCHFGQIIKQKPNTKPVTTKQYWNITLGNRTINVSPTMNKIKEKVFRVNRFIEIVKIEWKYNSEFISKSGQLAKMFFGGRQDGIQKTWSNCAACHSDLSAQNSKNDSTGHSKHLSIGLTCQECHGNVAHSNPIQLKRDDCIKCHNKGIPEPVSHKSALFTINHGKSFLQKNNCRICHIQGTKEKVCMDCHGIEMPHRKQYAEIHLDQIKLLGLKACQVCHIDEKKQSSPADGERLAVKKKEEMACAKCHGNKLLHNRAKAIPTHGEQAINKGTGACITCHKATECTECHGGVQMPHPNNFMQRHAIAAINGDRDNCEKCHNLQVNKAPICINCHWQEMPHPEGYGDRHQVMELPKGCEYCHSSKNPITNSVARAVSESRPTRRECRNCH